IICTKGRFGPYIKYGDKNISLPRGADPLKVSLEQCIGIITESQNKPAKEIISEFAGGIQVINGNYGPYIKYDGGNYRIPKGTEPAGLTEEKCKEIIAATKPTGRKRKK
ncbi:MAG: DNA topoisomerase I, partial [Bacteroidales bacterium]|nr:DNA topoisomerase I [Bacteroidales bacterium]